jgi:hypothetical protein
MRAGSDLMMTVLLLALASGLLVAGYAWQGGRVPDPERKAGQLWADVSKLSFDQCPRDNGTGFWMGCTDRAPMRGPRR